MDGTERDFGELRAQFTGRTFTDQVLSQLADREPDWVIVEVSGGHESTGMLYAVDESDKIDVDAVVHFNTGIGAEFTRQYVREQCARLGLPYIEGIQPKMERRYAARVIKNGFPGANPIAHEPHRIGGKQDVEDKLVQSLDGEIVILTGVRRHESQRRKITVSESGIQEDTRHEWVVYGGPIAEYTGTEVNEVLKRNDVDRNEFADLLDSSGECLCGTFASFWDLAYLWQYEPMLLVGIWNLMKLAEQYWIEYYEENGEPPYPRQYLIWGHGAVGRGALSEMVVGSLDDPADFCEDDEQRADRDEEQTDLSDKCASCNRPAATDGGRSVDTATDQAGGADQ